MSVFTRARPIFTEVISENVICILGKRQNGVVQKDIDIF